MDVRELIESIADDPEEVDGEWDSLFHLKVIVNVEQHFGVEFETSEVKNLTSIKAIQDRLEPAVLKCVVVDLDGVMWEGVIGESDDQGLFVSDRNVEFQQALKDLKDSGVMLAVASKNELADAVDAFNMSFMVLDWEDFSAHRVCWDQKYDSIKTIAAELNISPSSIAFFDDSKHERELVSRMLPQVTVMEECTAEAVTALMKTGIPTAEDKIRTSSASSERMRSCREAETLEEYQESLKQVITVERLSSGNVSRASQLFRRANQCHLDLKRWSEAALERFPGVGIVIKVTDRFGDAGRVGVALINGDNLEAFVVSCRVLGHGVEQALLAEAFTHTSGRMVAQYVPGPCNTVCKRAMLNAGATPMPFVGDDPGFPQDVVFKTRPEFPKFTTVLYSEEG